MVSRPVGVVQESVELLSRFAAHYLFVLRGCLVALITVFRALRGSFGATRFARCAAS